MDFLVGQMRTEIAMKDLARADEDMLSRARRTSRRGENRERLADAISILEWAADEGSGEAARRLLLLGLDPDLPGELRPDAEFWLTRFGEQYPNQRDLIQYYRDMDMSLKESYLAVQELSPEDRYKELFNFRDRDSETGLDELSIQELPPGPTHVVAPDYPEGMRFLKMEGTVTVLMVVHVDGTLGHFEVEDSPHPDFSEAALEALRQQVGCSWLFRFFFRFRMRLPAGDEPYSTMHIGSAYPVPWGPKRRKAAARTDRGDHSSVF